MVKLDRVVITGVGAITPIGLNPKEFWEGLVGGRNGIVPITAFDTTRFSVKLGGEVKGFKPEDYMTLKRVDRSSRVSQFAIAAARQAIESAKLNMSLEKPERVGVVIATGGMVSTIGDQGDILRSRGPNRVDPLMASKVGPNMVGVHVGMELGARGPNTTLNSACASGSDSLGEALNHLRLGHADVIIAGGSDCTITPITIASTNIVGALSRNPDPESACRPFDLNRNGFIFGEGAGMVLLETYEHAKSRGAAILAELAGAGWTFDAYDATAPYAEMQALAMKNAIADAGISPAEIDYINAHGTSTGLNDVTETKAIKLVFGMRAYQIPISSNKSMIGHLATAAGSVEAVAAVLTIKGGIIPPTIHYRVKDPECDLDYVPNKAREQKVNTCLSNSFGLGGQNCCLIIKRIA